MDFSNTFYFIQICVFFYTTNTNSDGRRANPSLKKNTPTQTAGRWIPQHGLLLPVAQRDVRGYGGPVT